MTAPYKIVILIDSFTTGGAQTQILEFLKNRNRTDFEYWLINLDDKVQTLTQAFTDQNVHILHIDHHGFFNPSTILKLTSLFKKIKPDVVQTYLFTADTYGRIAAILSRAPVIVTSIRSLDTWKKNHHLIVDKLLEKFTDQVTINAEAIRPRLKKLWNIKDEKILTIYNGIDLNRFNNPRSSKETRLEFGLTEEDILVGMVGKFRFEKDYESYFQAAALLQPIFPHAYFMAVGNGPKLKEIQHYVKTQTPHVKAVFTDARRDAPDLIHAMDIGVLATHAEGCPNAIMEYMAASKPVVSSNVGGCKELVVHNETGFLLEDKDVRAYAAHIRTLIESESLRQKMGKAGRARIESEFSTRALTEKTEGLYRSLIAKKLGH